MECVEDLFVLAEMEESVTEVEEVKNEEEEVKNDVDEVKNDKEEPIKEETTNSKKNDYYFASYSKFPIHEQMLKDEVRTLTYRDAICYNRHLFKDKVVLDVGCGTGILSMFAAQAGASKVYAVECSEVVKYAREIIRDNNFAEVITVVEGRVEDVELPDCDKVDIIISEWMGYCLFYEAMLDTVLFARDKWLRPDGGMMFPDRCSLFLAAVESGRLKAQRVNWWNHVHDFDMSCIRDVAIGEPVVTTVRPKQVLTSAFKIKEIDLYTVTKADLDFVSPFRLIAKQDRAQIVHGLMTFFTVDFTKCHRRLGFSTAPDAPPTHWRQTIFFLNESFRVKKNEEIYGQFRLRPNDRNNRDMDISIDLYFQGELSHLQEKNHYRMR